MGKETIKEKILSYVAGKAFAIFLWASGLTLDQYIKQIVVEEKNNQHR